MRSRLLVGLAALATGVSAACGGSSAETGAGGATTGAGGAASSSSSHASSTSTSGSGGAGGTGDGNDTFATATPIAIPSQTQGALSPTGDVDDYTFDGKKGQVVWAYITDAQTTNQAAFDSSWIDTVITLYDGSQQQIAENNEPRPHRSNDAELFTILPADGTYYLRVTECHTWAMDPSKQCSGSADKTNVSYTLAVAEPDPTQNGWVADIEQGDDPASATAVDYAPTSSGGYYLTAIWGTFRDASDIDVYSFTLPPDVTINNRSTASVIVLPSGPNGNGSTTPPGNIWITDATTPTSTYALVDGTKTPYEMRPPLALDHPYLLFVQHPSTAAGSNDFYFFLHGIGDSNPLEKADPGGNDTVATAESLSVTMGSNGIQSYFFEGDIVPAPTDLDHFVAAVPSALAAQTTLSLACSAQRNGSGLRGFKATLLTGDGTPIAGGALAETDANDAFLSGVAIPAGATQVVVRAQAASQDPAVSSTFYRCGLHFVPPSP